MIRAMPPTTVGGREMAETSGLRGPWQSNTGSRKRPFVKAYEGEAMVRKLRWEPNGWETSQRWIAEVRLEFETSLARRAGRQSRLHQKPDGLLGRPVFV